MNLSPGTIAQVACLLEVTAKKPGNVHRFRDFDDASYLDFAISAAAIGPAMNLAKTEGVGRAVLSAIEATRALVKTNTNLGMILLLAPLCAAETPRSVGKVLDTLTIEDARLAYRAIRLANPGGLGFAAHQDVADEPSVTLLEAMKLAADRDLVARQYANGYAEIFNLAVPTMRRALDGGQSLDNAIATAFLTLLANHHDTLILRKRGPLIAAEASSRAKIALDSGDLEPLDDWLREDGHSRNPGATADLIAAALYVAIAENIFSLPLSTGLSPCRSAATKFA